MSPPNRPPSVRAPALRDRPRRHWTTPGRAGGRSAPLRRPVVARVGGPEPSQPGTPVGTAAVTGALNRADCGPTLLLTTQTGTLP